MLVQLMGGQLTVDTAPGRGSTFTVRLQLPRVHAPARTPAAPAFAPAGYAGPRRRILVVDNERNDRELLVNILGNAVKFTARGEVVLRVRYAREMASFEVQDSGPGILPDEVERIFEPYARGSAGAAAGVAGTGLGLPISRMLVQLMGGQLTVDTAPGRGSTFTVRLQLPRVHLPAPARVAPAFAPSGYTGPRRRILVVDNERNDRELLVNILAPLGFETLQAETGADCVALQARFQPDLILMDLAMPGIDGWEASRILRRDLRVEVPILIVSANAYDKNLDNPAGIAAEDFIVKPVNVAELLERIGARLGLDWAMRDAPAPAPAPVPAFPASPPVSDRAVPRFPPAAQLAALRAQLALGHVRGIVRELDALAALDPEYAAFTDTLRKFATRFDLEAMAAYLDQETS
jgi:CheY-like chemotaxis protein